jgi:glycosyltransferase involved in cell wall biosynthesis
MGVDLTVILPAYNMGAYVEEALRSVLSPDIEGGGGIEVIVLDDGSTDETQQVVRRFTDRQSDVHDPRVHYYRHQNCGKSKTVNRGFALARGRYVTILDADDRVTASGMSARLQAVRRRSHCADLIVGRCEVFGENGTLDRWSLPNSRNPETLRKQFLYGINQPFHLNAAMWSAELLEQVGGFNPDNPRCHDIDYAARLLAHTSEVDVLDSTVYRYRKYRSTLRGRLRVRGVTLVDRARVATQHLEGGEQILAVLTGGMVDLAKLLFEVFVGAYPSRS